VIDALAYGIDRRFRSPGQKMVAGVAHQKFENLEALIHQFRIGNGVQIEQGAENVEAGLIQGCDARATASAF